MAIVPDTGWVAGKLLIPTVFPTFTTPETFCVLGKFVTVVVKALLIATPVGIDISHFSLILGW